MISMRKSLSSLHRCIMSLTTNVMEDVKFNDYSSKWCTSSTVLLMFSAFLSWCNISTYQTLPDSPS